MKFTESLKRKAIESLNGELAWKKQDIFSAIDELIENGNAILGGDVWAVLTEFNRSENILTRIEPHQIAVGLIKDKNNETNVFNWYTNRMENESWTDYMNRTKEESIKAIEILNAEKTTKTKYRNSIFYNLVFCNENEFEKLIE